MRITGIQIEEFIQTDVGQEVVSNLWVNRDRDNHDYGSIEVEEWEALMPWSWHELITYPIVL